MAIILKHQTESEFITRLRNAYRNKSKGELAKLAKWIIARIQAGDVTEIQIQNAFGLSTPQWDQLKSRMQTLVSNYDAIESAEGE